MRFAYQMCIGEALQKDCVNMGWNDIILQLGFIAYM